MAQRLREIRHLFREYLEKNSVPGKWENITKQGGFFSYTGLTGQF
jgi:aspartate/tyrosine/aromatic aminotransferase